MIAVVNNFISLLTAPGFAGVHGEVVLINLFVIIVVNVIALVIMLALLDYKTIFFHIATTLTLFILYGYIELTFFGGWYINILFYIRIYLVFLVFPFIFTYLFHKKIVRNVKFGDPSIGKTPIHSEISLQELAEFQQINRECPLSEEDLVRQSLQASGNTNNSSP